MALVVTVAQQKGGAGKTTLVANLAAAWAATRQVGVLDIDPQRSLARWHALREAQVAREPGPGTRGTGARGAGAARAQAGDAQVGAQGAAGAGLRPILCSDAAGWKLANELDRMARGVDIILVDSAPHIDTDARRAIRAAALVLVPVQPSLPDLWAAEGTMALAAAEKRPARLVMNRAPARSRLRSAVEAEAARRGWAMLTPALGSRSAYAQAFAQGMGVTETSPRSAACVELLALVAAIEEMLP